MNGDQVLFDKMLKDVPKKMKVITVYSIVEQFKVNGALARRSIAELYKRGLIKPVAHTSAMLIYTKA